MGAEFFDTTADPAIELPACSHGIKHILTYQLAVGRFVIVPSVPRIGQTSPVIGTVLAHTEAVFDRSVAHGSDRPGGFSECHQSDFEVNASDADRCVVLTAPALQTKFTGGCDLCALASHGWAYRWGRPTQVRPAIQSRQLATKKGWLDGNANRWVRKPVPTEVSVRHAVSIACLLILWFPIIAFLSVSFWRADLEDFPLFTYRGKRDLAVACEEMNQPNVPAIRELRDGANWFHAVAEFLHSAVGSGGGNRVLAREQCRGRRSLRRLDDKRHDLRPQLQHPFDFAGGASRGGIHQEPVETPVTVLIEQHKQLRRDSREGNAHWLPKESPASRFAASARSSSVASGRT